MKTFECPRCGHDMEVAPESVGKAATCSQCGNVVTVRPNQPSKADQRGTAAGPGVNPVVFVVVTAVLIAFAAVGLGTATGVLSFGPPARNAVTDLQDDASTNQQKLEANVPSQRTQPNQEPGDNEPSLDPQPDSPGSATGASAAEAP